MLVNASANHEQPSLQVETQAWPQDSRSSPKRKKAFAAFFSIALTVYGLINFYIFLRGWEALGRTIGGAYIAIFLLLSLSYIASRFLERVSVTWLSSALVWIGSFWLAAMVYFLLGIVAIDAVRLVNHLVPFLPQFITQNGPEAARLIALMLVGIVVITVAAGYFNARVPRIRRLEFSIPRRESPFRHLTIAVASDIHLGTIISHRRLTKLVAAINNLKPDLVLLPGDVIDEDLAPVIRRNLGEVLRTFRSTYGTFAVTGNHEYIGGIEPACRYLEQHGITLLRDRAVTINGGVTIVGREDRSIGQFTNHVRKPLPVLLNGTDPGLPVILMDHQPFHLEEAEQSGVDLQLSGHTHHGQLWPFNFITKRVYELSWGYTKKSGTHVYVSCGAGTWGPPIRTGNTPEILDIRCTFC